jgi:hypothetical protein
MSTVKPKPIKSKNTKENKLKRYDARWKAHLIKDRIESRIAEFTSMIPELDAQGKKNEHMIAIHRRNELEELHKWIQEHIIDAQSIGTRHPLKIWDVLKYGEVGEVYQATNTIETWNGCEIQVIQVGDHDPNHIIVFAKTPKVRNSRLMVGGVVDLVGAVTRADWVFIGKKERVTAPARNILMAMCLEMARILNYLCDKSIYMGANPHDRIRLDLSSTIDKVLNQMDKNIGDFLANTEIFNSEYPPHLDQWNAYRQELMMAKSFIPYMNDDELGEKIEGIICLTYFFYKTWWGEWEWDDRIAIKLSEEEMMEIAKAKLFGHSDLIMNGSKQS